MYKNYTQFNTYMHKNFKDFFVLYNRKICFFNLIYEHIQIYVTNTPIKFYQYFHNKTKR